MGTTLGACSGSGASALTLAQMVATREDVYEGSAGWDVVAEW
jgi:hypothetical protein